MRTRLALAAAAALALSSLTAWLPAQVAHAALPLGAFGASIPPPAHQGPHSFGTFCRSVYAVPRGFAAVKFDADLTVGSSSRAGNNWRAAALHLSRGS